jgi:hypothetical protein
METEETGEAIEVVILLLSTRIWGQIYNDGVQGFSQVH